MISVLAACGPDPSGPSADPNPFDEVPLPAAQVVTEVGVPTSRFVAVAFTEGASREAAAAAVAAAGGRVAGTVVAARVALIDPGTTPAREVIAALRASPVVAGAGRDLLVAAENVPAPGGSGAWNEPFSGSFGLQAIQAPQAWHLEPHLRGREGPRVAVIDEGFTAEADFPAETRFLTDPPCFGGMSCRHGTAVVGLIGARWGNGAGADGVSPFVSVDAASLGDTSGFGSAPATWTRLIASTFGELDSSPRIVNLSLGLNLFRSGCDLRTVLAQLPQGSEFVAAHVRDRRPRGSTCTNLLDTLELFEDFRFAAFLFGQTVLAANRGGKQTLFVISAGNGNGALGFENYPAVLSSPATYAALSDPAIGAHVIVAEASRPTGEPDGPVDDADFSNIDGEGIVAPGTGMKVLGYDTPQFGTSFAAPMISGAAAYLATIVPGVSNSRLQALLRVAPWSPVPTRSGEHALSATALPTRTRNALDLYASVRAVDELAPVTVSVRKLLADMDDGTPDGFTRTDFGPDGTPNVATVMPRPTRRAAPRVDMADFRYLRDTRLFQLGTLRACPATIPSCDLNGDGRAEDARTGEPYPRALLQDCPTFGPDRACRRVDTADAVRMGEVWDGGPGPQAWTREDLPGLLDSADILLRSAAFRARARVGSFQVSIGRGASLEGLQVVADEVLLTTPQRSGVTIRVVAAGATFEGRIADLSPGEDRLVVLNPCAINDDGTPNREVTITTPIAPDQCRAMEEMPPPDTGTAAWDLDRRGRSSRTGGRRSGGSWGDPHLTTLDGLAYDLQLTGELVLVDDGAGLRAHVRQEPYDGSRWVAANTALAAQVGGDRVMLHLAAAGLEVRVGGAVRALAADGVMELPGGGAVRRLGDTYALYWPNDDRIGVRASNRLDLYVLPAAVAGRTFRGLVGGPVNDVPEDDLVTRGGETLPMNAREQDVARFGVSWRISAGESLMTYGMGQSPATFADDTFPAAPFDASSLEPEVYARARALCLRYGVTDPQLLRACILDVGLTGDSSFIAGARAARPPRRGLRQVYFFDDFEDGQVDTAWAGLEADAIGGAPGSRVLGPFGTRSLGSGNAVTLALPAEEPHDQVRVSFDLHVLGPWRGVAEPERAFELNAVNGRLLWATFSNGAEAQSFPGAHRIGSNPAGTGAFAPGVYHVVRTYSNAGPVLLSFEVPDAGDNRWALDDVQVELLSTRGATVEEVGAIRVVHGPSGAPADVGCTDGTREAFHDAARFPNVAGCLASWSGTPSLRASPRGPGDACAPGWHVCASGPELRAIAPDACQTAGAGAYLGAASLFGGGLMCADASAALSCTAGSALEVSACCGAGCTLSPCSDAIWPGWTRGALVSCGAAAAAPAMGLLCCR